MKSLRAAEAESNGRKTSKPFPSWPCELASYQLALGLKEEAWRTLQEAALSVPEASANFNEAYNTVSTLFAIVRTQLRIGDSEHARENVKRIEKIAAEAPEADAA